MDYTFKQEDYIFITLRLYSLIHNVHFLILSIIFNSKLFSNFESKI